MKKKYCTKTFSNEWAIHQVLPGRVRSRFFLLTAPMRVRMMAPLSGLAVLREHSEYTLTLP